MTILVSIIIINYSGKELLSECLESIRKTTYDYRQREADSSGCSGDDRGPACEILHRRARLLDGGVLKEDEIKKIDGEIREIINEAAEFSQSAPEPDPTELWTDVYA